MTGEPIEPNRPSEAAENRPRVALIEQSSSQPARPRGPRMLRWLVLLVPVLLVAGPVLVGEFPREIGLWYGAAALEHHLDGDMPAALSSLETGLAWAPNNVSMLLQRSEWRVDAGDITGALADAEAALAARPRDPAAYVQRSAVFQKMGEHRKAIDDWNSLEELAKGATRISLRSLSGLRKLDIFNGRAYARAVAGIEMQEGLMDAQRSIDRIGENVAVLDTRGYLYYRNGSFDKARYDLDKAVDEAESYYAQVSREFESDKGDPPPPIKNEPTLRRQFLDLRKLRRFRQEMAELVAVTRYHRALALEGLDETEAAERDLKRVRELGFEPGPDLY